MSDPHKIYNWAYA